MYRKLISLERATNNYWQDFGNRLFPRRRLNLLARKVYNYHNLGVGSFPENEEKTPYGSGERYNFDRMYMMASNYDFTNKNIVDLGCNSGWFCIQSKFLGSNITVGIDYERTDMISGMIPAVEYAIQWERVFKLGIKFMNVDLKCVCFKTLANSLGVKYFDAAFLLSVLHHFGENETDRKTSLFASLFTAVKDVIFYEDHEFWNDLCDKEGKKIAVKGDGYRYGWNEDLSWQRKIYSIESYEKKILEYYRSTWRKNTLMLDHFKEVRFLGFSEKRRPMLALFK